MSYRSFFKNIMAVVILSLIGAVFMDAVAAAEDAPKAPADDWVAFRPRLFFTPEKTKRLKQRVDTDKALAAAWEKQLELAERLLDEKLVSKERAESGSGQHGNYGGPSSQVSRLASVLGLAYRMTGDKRYARKLRDALIHYGGYNRWAGDAHHDPPWHSELNTARFCFAYAVGYDSIHDFLSEPERTTIRKSMIRLGIMPTLNDWVLSGVIPFRVTWQCSNEAVFPGVSAKEV